MASVIVVDNGLKDSIQEYAQIIDTINGNTDFTQQLQPLLPTQQDQEITNQSDIYQKINENSTVETLKKLTDREFEPTIYLLIHILSQLSSIDQVLNDTSSSVYKLILSVNPQQPLSLRDRKSIKSSSILSILSTIFNLIPRSSNTRIFLIKSILNILKTSEIDFNSIEDNIANNLITWLKESNASDEETKEIFWNFILLDSGYTLKSLELIQEFTNSFTLSNSELENLIKFALSSKIVDVSFLVNNNVALALKNSNTELSKTFTKYVKGELIPVNEINESSLNAEFVHQKSRILNLTKFLAEQSLSPDHDDIVFKYSEISDLKPSETEELLVESIKAGVIEGKINQIDETFNLSRVNRFVIAGDDQSNEQKWDLIKNVLQQWSNSISNIDEIVKATRENIVNSSSN
ncbi:uncharacterized protein KGF55_001717 [Candida pseudojiufengensis]|uniref:uncharacterized protein n=1 Tax=Candida pseudojiufengensis TaxID=497109 RepID=UPI0022256DE4|nr:uncharacterized protein KGF55_001717 [Candida pseudojiufengensis]KAI5964648.1 hypothetical protein KGF55_001717 [Candida pseudojiufengensis]